MNDLEIFRRQIDQFDDYILDLLADRLECARQIGKIKRANGDPIIDPVREKDRLECLAVRGRKRGFTPEEIENLWKVIFAMAYQRQE